MDEAKQIGGLNTSSPTTTPTRSFSTLSGEFISFFSIFEWIFFDQISSCLDLDNWVPQIKFLFSVSAAVDVSIPFYSNAYRGLKKR